MSLQKIAAVVDRLLGLTKNNELVWETTETEEVFQVSFANSSIKLSYRPTVEEDTEDDDIDYVVTVLNNSGLVVEEVSDIELRDYMTDSFDKLDELYELARGYALGTEQILDSLIDELELDV